MNVEHLKTLASMLEEARTAVVICCGDNATEEEEIALDFLDNYLNSQAKALRETAAWLEGGE